MMTRRGLKDASNKIGMYPEWSWSWPVNRRIIYNRAAVNRKGEPWDPKRWVVKWTGSAWKGDVVDGGATAGPDQKNPFIMNAEGVARLFAPALADGPFPEHTSSLLKNCPPPPLCKELWELHGQFNPACFYFSIQ
jgi:formate dehydrogenase major subunit